MCSRHDAMIGQEQREVPEERPVAVRAAVRREVDVAVIGNGPSAIFLSLVLSGYWPYYNGSHPNHYLAAKLGENPKKSLLEQDLQYLSEGLEGRSTNPVALLFDTLMQPNEDIGESHPPALSWAYHPCKAISHVVLGRGKPGGSWHRMQPDIMSLSTGRWLQLPIYEYEAWERKREEGRRGGEGGGGGGGGEEEGGGGGGRESGREGGGGGGAEGGRVDGRQGGKGKGSGSNRVTLGSVAQYYEHYVKEMSLTDNFINGATVTQVSWKGPRDTRAQSCESTFSVASSVESGNASTCTASSSPFLPGNSPLPTTDVDDVNSTDTVQLGTVEDLVGEENQLQSVCENESVDNDVYENGTGFDSDDTGISCCTKRMCMSSSSECRWSVCGRRMGEDGQEECVSVCAKNLVLATGVSDWPKRLGVPGENLEFVHHGSMDIDDKLSCAKEHRDPILIVGAGLSAADTVLHALDCGLTVVHVFYQDPFDQTLIYNKMDTKMYSEYVKLFRMMQGKFHHPNYTPLAQHRVMGFRPECVCTVSNKEGEQTDVAVSLAVVLIGGQAQLDFLPKCISRNLGVHTDHPIEVKKNPMDIDAYTFESDKYPSLYAIGPLTGDNFVRFVLGGAIGITQNLLQKLEKS